MADEPSFDAIRKMITDGTTDQVTRRLSRYLSISLPDPA
jgi:hypothetical protein